MLTPGTRVRVDHVDIEDEQAKRLTGLEGVVTDEGAETSFYQWFLGMVGVTLELSPEQEAEQRELAESLDIEYNGRFVFWPDELVEIETPVEA